MPHPTPRVFIIRHGETEWSLNGRHTGTSDIPLTANGERRILATGRALVGPDRLIVRDNIAAVYVSPRTRARRTLGLLLEAGGIEDIGVPGYERSKEEQGQVGREDMKEVAEGKDGGGGRHAGREDSGKGKGLEAKVTEDIVEWDYGEYEGVTSKEIAAQRRERGEKTWDIWSDGCPGGESPEQITTRLDRLIAEIRTTVHAPALQHIASGSSDKAPPCDVLVVAHGHILRAFAARWVNRNVHDNPGFLLEAGGVGTLSYEHHSIDEPAILLGGAFVVDAVRDAEQEGEEKAKEKEKEKR